MEKKQCRDCQHYRQHYSFDQRKIFQVYCGHCVLARIKSKKPDAKACEHYIPGLTEETSFVTKEYLSKQLLQYMLELDLLPEIEDEG